MITEIDVFNEIYEKVIEKYPNCKIVSDYELETKSLPCVWAKEIDSYEVSSARNLDSSEKVRTSQFEIQVFSKERNVLYELRDICKETMKQINYRCSMSQDIDNTDITIKRHVMRFDRVICDNDYIGD